MIPSTPSVRAADDLDRDCMDGPDPPGARWYLARSIDRELEAAVSRRDECVVRIKGAHHTGKSSLLRHGLEGIRARGFKTVRTDFQDFSTDDLEQLDTLFRAVARSLSDQLQLGVDPAQVWSPRHCSSLNLERFLRREVLQKAGAPLVWALDEVDRLFSTRHASEVFGPIRAWHEARNLEPNSPWQSLVIVIAHRSEPDQFITPLCQSPFNVGVALRVADFTREEVAELNHRFGHPLKEPDELDRLQHWVGGHPDLVRRSLGALAAGRLDLATFEARAAKGDGVFRGHLEAMLEIVDKNQELREVVRNLLIGQRLRNEAAFLLLRSAGILTGQSPEDMQIRCRIYATFLRRRLNA